MNSFNFIIGLTLISGLIGNLNAVKHVESAYIPLQLQCSCSFLNMIKVNGVFIKDAFGQYTRAEDHYPGVEAAADQECRKQLPNSLKRCDVYLTGFGLGLDSDSKISITYQCLVNGTLNNTKTSFSEGADDVRLVCPGSKDSIDIKEIRVEDGQAPLSVQTANQDCAMEISFNFPPPIECTVNRYDRLGCILVLYECLNMDDNGGAPVFPTFRK